MSRLCGAVWLIDVDKTFREHRVEAAERLYLSNSNRGPWAGFLIMAFAVVGLIGAFGIYAAQIPFERALARNATLDRVLAARGDPARLELLRPLLDDSARVLGGSGDLTARVAGERARMWEAFGQDSVNVGFRLRIVILAFAATGALFGTAVLSIASRGPSESRGLGGGSPPSA